MAEIIGSILGDSERPLPVIRVDLFNSPLPYIPGSGMPAIFQKNVVALLDTGSSHGVIDRTLVEKGKLPILEKGFTETVDAVTHNVNIYLCGVFTDSDRSIFVGSFVAADLKGQRKPYDLFLGMEFLRYYEMRMDVRKGTLVLSK